CVVLFFLNDAAPTEIYPLSLHDALPIYPHRRGGGRGPVHHDAARCLRRRARSEEHTSELQSHLNLVCRLLLEKSHDQGGDAARQTMGGGSGKAAVPARRRARGHVLSHTAARPVAARTSLSSAVIFLKYRASTRPPPSPPTATSLG